MLQQKLYNNLLSLCQCSTSLRYWSSNDDDDESGDDDDADDIMMGDEEDVAKGNNSCWSPMQSSEDENENEEQLDTNGDDDDHCKEEANNGNMRRKSNNNNNNNNDKNRSVRDKMKLARKAAFAKRDEDDDDSSSSSSEEDDIYEDTKQPHIKSISSNNPKDEESLEVLKQQILGRSITSMYDIDHTAEAALSSHQSSFTFSNRQQQQRHIHTTDGTTVANTLRQELSCPICHDRLYNPSSLLCGHTFCMSCLNWWLDRQQQQSSRRGDNDANNNDNMMMMNNQSDDEEEEEEWHGTCPTCREPIPPSPSPSSTGGLTLTRSKKPNIQVNTALKAVLETLYGNEMNQRRQAEYRQQLKARSGENDGLHTRGYEEIVTLVNNEDEKDELSFLKD